MIINTATKEIEIIVANQKSIIKYALQGTKGGILQLAYDSREAYENDNEEQDNDIEYQYILEDEEIDEKISQYEELDIGQQNLLRELIIEYRDVFEKRPGLFTAYEHKLVLRDEN